MERKILSVENLFVQYKEKIALRNISFDLKKGEILGVIGESGSGKSTLAHALIRLLPDTSTFKGKVILNSHSIFDLKEEVLETRIRGRECGIIFQSPAARFNPVMSIHKHFNEMFEEHIGKKFNQDKIFTLLKEVGLKNTILKDYSTIISGGMAQRAMIALNLVLSPSILIADEPTTALDTINESNIINLLKLISEKNKVGIILISHNIELIKRIANRVMVLYRGDLMELNDISKIGKHPYTKHLLHMNNILSEGEALLVRKRKNVSGCKYYSNCIYRKEECKVEIPLIDNVRCIRQENLTITEEVRKIKIEKTISTQSQDNKKDKLLSVDIKNVSLNKKEILNNINFNILKGESIGIVGESGSGKTTLANTILGLNKYHGKINYYGEGNIAAIFQDPNRSLNPNMTIASSISEPMYLKKAVNMTRIKAILRELSLPDSDDFLKLYPKNLSGGEKQRILIGRALSVNTNLIVADEATSMLDATTKAELVAVLKSINLKKKIAYLYITHDLKIALNLCYKIMVIKDGVILESFLSQNQPKTEYGKELLKACYI